MSRSDKCSPQACEGSSSRRSPSGSPVRLIGLATKPYRRSAMTTAKRDTTPDINQDPISHPKRVRIRLASPGSQDTWTMRTGASFRIGVNLGEMTAIGGRYFRRPASTSRHAWRRWRNQKVSAAQARSAAGSLTRLRTSESRVSKIWGGRCGPYAIRIDCSTGHPGLAVHESDLYKAGNPLYSIFTSLLKKFQLTSNINHKVARIPSF